MSAKGIWLFLGLGAAVLITGAQQSGAQYVDFNNTVLVPYVTDGDVLVRFSQGVPVTGTNIVAQLYYGPSATSLVAHTAAPARFRVPTTQLPGTWIGGFRTLTGVSVGSVIVMAVRVWDINTGPTFEQASSRLDCGPFYYEVKPEGLAPTNYYMFEFRSVREPVYNFLPLFQTQPQSQVINSGDTLTLSPTVLNASLYQWRFIGQIVGFRPTLVISNAQASHSGSYELIAGNYSGSVTSQTAVISVEPPPQWGEVNFASHVLPVPPDRLLRYGDGQPILGTNVFAQLYYGTNEQQLVAVTDPPATFRHTVSDLYGTWRGGQRTLVGILPGTPVLLRVCVWDGRLGETIEEAIANEAFWSCGPTFPYTPPAHGSPAEAYYMLNFTNFISPCSAEGQGPTIILTQPVDQTAYVGESVTFSVSATNHCLFQWRHEGTNVTGARSPGLRLNNVQPSQAGEYHVFVTHASGSGGVFSEVARLTVLSRPPEISSARHSNGAFAFQVSEDTGGAVVIETAPDLNPGTTWTPVFTNTAPFSFTNSTPAERQRFYRTVVP